MFVWMMGNGRGEGFEYCVHLFSRLENGADVWYSCSWDMSTEDASYNISSVRTFMTKRSFITSYLSVTRIWIFDIKYFKLTELLNQKGIESLCIKSRATRIVSPLKW